MECRVYLETDCGLLPINRIFDNPEHAEELKQYRLSQYPEEQMTVVITD